MKAVAAEFGKKCLRETDEADVIAAIPALREKLGDRAVLRALHFFNENRRVKEQTAALKANDVGAFFEGVKASGRSSACYLQNAYSTKDVNGQGVTLAVNLAENFLSDKGGASRLHGGGFAGTTQAFVPSEYAEEYKAYMEKVFGEGSCYILRVRPVGATKIV